jgi:hypothetical protein
VSVGGVLREAWRLYRLFFWRGLLIATPLFVVFSIPGAAVDTLHDTTWTVAAASTLVGLFTTYGDFLVEGVLAADVRDHEAGLEPPGAADLIRHVRPRLLTLLLAVLVYSVCITAGVVLLVVPGLIVLVYWSVVVPVIVLEGHGMRAAFRRSYRLVRGHFWPVLGILGILLVGSALLETGFDNLLFFLPEFFASWIGHLVVSALTAPYAAHALAVIYYRLVDSRGRRSS